MLSSTSSSSHQRSPTWGRAWLLGLALMVAVLGAWEYVLREHGHLPSVDDSHELWSWHRARVGGDRTLVLLGASRMLLDIDMATLRARYPAWRVVQLGINGRYPLFALQDLARDEAFHGVAIVALNAQALEPFYRNMQQDYLDYFRQQSSLNNRLNERIGASVQNRLVGLHPLLRLQTLLDHQVRHGNLPEPFYLRTRADRSFAGDYQRVNRENVRAHFVTTKANNYRDRPPTPAAAWLQQTGEIEDWISKIQQRGGQVVWLRLPTADAHWDLDEQYYPREQYWDPFVASSSALAVHARDIPGVETFDLPDTSHLDYRDSPAFTTLLFGYLEQQWPGLFAK